MKALKIIGMVLVGVIAIVAILLVVALTPSFQMWAVRKAVASQPGLKLDMSRVSAGFTATELRDVHVVKDGITITAKRISAKYSAWDYVSRKRLTVDDIAVEDLLIDTRPTAGQPAQSNARVGTGQQPAPGKIEKGEPKLPFRGLLSEVKLPFDVRIARFSIPGQALLPNEQTATFEVRGSGITTGERGTIDWKADLTNAQANAPFRVLHTSGTSNVHITTERRIDVAEVNAIASVEGPNLPTDQIKLEAKAEQPAAGGNEGYTATVALVRGGTAEPLLTLAGQYSATAHEIAGAWNVTIRSQQLAAMLTGLGLPDVAVDGAGKFATQPDNGSVKATGELRSDVTRLEKISAELAPIGSLRLEIKFDGGLSENVARLEQFALDATAANGRKLAEIRVLQRIGYALQEKRVSFADAKADLARITIQALPLAWAQPLAKSLTIDSGDLSAVFAVAAEADGSRVRLTSVEPLLLRNVTVRNGQQKLAEQMTLSVKPQADYAADHLRAELNDLAVSIPAGDTVNGRITVDITQLSSAPVVAFVTDTQAKFVAALKPYLSIDTGPITVSTKSEGTLSGQTLRFARSTTRVIRTSGPLLAAIDLQQPLSFNLQNKTLTSANPQAESLRLKLGEVPLAWAEAVVRDAKLSGQVSGGTIGLVLRAIDDITANVTEPVAVRGIGVVINGKPMLQNVDLTVDLTAAKQGQLVRYNVRRVEARQGTAMLLTLAVAGEAKLGTKPAISAKGTLGADLAALMQQPVTAGSAALARGSMNATFDATVADTVQAQATLTIRNLIARQNNQPMGDAELRVSAAVQPDGSSVLKMPFVLTNGDRKSDLLIDGKLSRAANTVTFNGRIGSNRLVIDDVRALAALAPASSTTPAATPAASAGSPMPRAATTRTSAANTTATAQRSATSPVAGVPTNRDSQAFWSAAAGKIDLDLKQIEYGRDYLIHGVRGTATLSPTQLSLDGIEGMLKNNPFRFSARIDFDTKQPQPYTLAALANVTNFDVGAFLKAASPNEKPQMETNVTVDAKLNGKGATMNTLLLNTYGNFDVTGSKGVLRALSRKGGEAVNLGSGLLGIAGALGKSDTTVAVADLTQKLSELQFDKFAMHVERGADLNLKIGHIEFLSPDTRIVGSGGLTNQPGVPVQNQPLTITLSLAGKDNMAFLLNRAGLLSGRQDEQGFYTMGTSFTLSGTPSKPNSNDLWRIIAEAGLKAAAGRFLGK